MGTMHGIVPILLTPFTPDRTIDVESPHSVVKRRSGGEVVAEKWDAGGEVGHCGGEVGH